MSPFQGLGVGFGRCPRPSLRFGLGYDMTALQALAHARIVADGSTAFVPVGTLVGFLLVFYPPLSWRAEGDRPSGTFQTRD